jgi:hypothetical protein
MMRGTLINISGKTNSGKTTLALAIAKNAAHSGLLLTIFDDADRMGKTLEPVVKKLLEQGAHVVTITHGHSVRPAVSITEQPDAFLTRALFGNGLVGFKVLDKSGAGDFVDVSSEEAEEILSNAADRIIHLAVSAGAVTSETPPSERLISAIIAEAFCAAGYIPGQTYEQAVEMAKWHPGMAEFMRDFPGEQAFELAEKRVREGVRNFG